jgi:hypothetical protein
MTGDQEDMLARMRAVLPVRWFADSTPVLDGLLSGLASMWSWAYSLLYYVRMQTRIATATDVWLDVIASDFFGGRLQRRAGQSDDAFRSLIQNSLLRDHGTRQSIVSAVQDLTGRTPIVFEPMRTSDTGGYSLGGIGYRTAGGWGNMSLPFQCFVTAYRPTGSGIALVAGWGCAIGAYSVGTIEYASLAMVQGQVTDSDIVAAIADVLPVTAIAWTRIEN